MTKIKRQYYPKRLDVSKEEVLRNRQQRKENRAKNRLFKQIKPQKAKRLLHEPKQLSFKFRIPLRRSKIHQVKNDCILFRDVQHDAGSTVTIQVDLPKYHYLDWFWTNMVLQNDPGIILFPNAKEQTESVGALFAAKTHIPQLKNATVIVVGDGNTPRTGYLFSKEAKKVVSVDPLMQTKWTLPNDVLPPNLQACSLTIEQFYETKWITEKQSDDDIIVLVAVHSHALFQSYVPQFNNGRLHAIIAIACCVEQETDLLVKTQTYDDFGILSPCRTICIWTKMNEC